MQILHTLYNYTMSSKQDIKKIIATIGGEEELAELYFALLIYGPQTISQLSRNSNIERTKIYRLLKTMQTLQLIEVELQPKRNIIKAAPISALELLINKKQQELDQVSEVLPRLEKNLNNQTLSSPLTKVQFYQGQEGAKQMLWNQTKANTETLSILHQNMQSHTGEEFYIRWAQRCNEQNLTFRSLVGDAFIKSQAEWSKSRSKGMLKNWHGRYIPSAEHRIQFWTCIYNNVVAYFSWHEYEIYGIEIYNQEISDANRDFFESLWSRSAPLKQGGKLFTNNS